MEAETIAMLKVAIGTLAAVIAVCVPTMSLYLVRQIKRHNEIEVGFTRAMDDSSRVNEKLSDTIDRIDSTLTNVHNEILRRLH